VVYNGVTLDGTTQSSGAFTPFVPVEGEPGRPYILALGRVVEKKGFDLLLAAYAAIDENHRTADLVIGGVGNDLENLRRRVAAIGIAERVHFVGRLSREEVAGAMDGAAMFVVPSRLEPFGIVILEAWRAGAAVVATNRGGPPEFVRDGLDGVLVDPFDTAAFANHLERLLLDPARRRALAQAGQSRVEEFGWPRIAESYRQIYSSVTGTEARRGSQALNADGTRPRSHQGDSVR
jgi:glycosyltransferase involved in cell wall biosynthesis